MAQSYTLVAVLLTVFRIFYLSFCELAGATSEYRQISPSTLKRTSKPENSKLVLLPVLLLVQGRGSWERASSASRFVSGKGKASSSSGKAT